jgi:Xaa-Pro aminopeptidase
MSDTRINNLRTKFETLSVDGMLIYQPENRKYLSAFDGSTGYLMITGTDAVLATDFRYVEQAHGEVTGCRVQRIEGPIKTWFPELVSDARVKRLGIEAGYATLSDFEKFKSTLENAGIKTELVPITDAVESLRIIKDTDEIKALEAAARLTDEALVCVTYKYLHPGVSEIKLAWELEKYIRESGAELSFPTIVAAGPASAMAHAKPSDRMLEVKGPVVIDMGVKIHGYCADLTRTFWLADVNSKFTELYRIVLQAQKAAVDGIVPGMTGAEADKLARDYIAEAGYADAFGHSLGHGLGMVVHENPRLGQNSQDVLMEGMVFTIEPGIYISGWGGIRIEDDAVLENGKVRLLTSSPK